MGIRDSFDRFRANNQARKAYEAWDDWRRDLGEQGRIEELVKIATPMVGKLAVVANFKDYYQPQGPEKHLRDLAGALNNSLDAKFVLVEPIGTHPVSGLSLAQEMTSQGLESEPLIDYSPKPEDRRIRGDLFHDIPEWYHEKLDEYRRDPREPNILVAVNRFEYHRHQENLLRTPSKADELGYVAIVSSQIFLDDENAGGFEYIDMQGGHAMVLKDIDRQTGQFTWSKVT